MIALRSFALLGLVLCLDPPWPQAPPKILVFSKTAGFRHDSIPDGVGALRGLGAENNFAVDATEDAAAFTDANLAQYRAVVFLSTTGEVLDVSQQAAFERFIRRGGGYAGVHSASDTEYDWPWYGGLVGAYFRDHPAIQRAVVRVEEPAHPSTEALPTAWERTDEWYNFSSNPRGGAHVLATLDEATYMGGGMGADHPIAWCRRYDGGRAWYTGGGHTRESYGEPLFRRHLLGGIQFAAGLAGGVCAGAESVSAASFRGGTLARDSIASVFGAGFAEATEAASSLPLPTSLAGAEVRVRDGLGVERPAPLFYASPTQINYLVPAEAAAGAARITVAGAGGAVAAGAAQIGTLAPGLFAANADGRGIAAGYVLRVRVDRSENVEPIARLEAGRYLAQPIDLGPPTDEVFLVLFGTGLRGRPSLASVAARVGGVAAEVLYAGGQGQFAGLDQINLRLGRELAGRGEVEVTLTVEGQAANEVRVNVR